jgi:hypothetical protein
MPKGLRRFHNTGQRHFITCSCYRRQPFLGSARRRDYFLKVFEEVRQKYDLVVWGYVVMPEHFHILNAGLLLSSKPGPTKGKPSAFRFLYLKQASPLKYQDIQRVRLTVGDHCRESPWPIFK